MHYFIIVKTITFLLCYWAFADQLLKETAQNITIRQKISVQRRSLIAKLVYFACTDFCRLIVRDSVELTLRKIVKINNEGAFLVLFLTVD